MSDRVFFSSAVLIAIALVALALLPGMNARPTGPVSGGNTDYQRIEVRGEQLHRMLASADSDISVERIDGTTVLRIEVEDGIVQDDPQRGPHFVLDTDLETVFANRKLRITVRARAANRRGAEAMLLNYSTGNTRQSGWEEFTLTREFQDFEFIYNLPARDVGTQPGYDYFGIRPVVPEKSRALLVESVVFEPIGPPRSAEGS